MTVPAHSVFITRLGLRYFRNHEHLVLEPGRHSAALIGANGVGKTNVLEALSLLAPGRGLRRAAREAIAFEGGNGGYALSARIERGEERTEIGIEATKDAARVLSIDGARPMSLETLPQHVRLLWLTPAMDTLFTGPASERRRFLDRLVLTIDPAHGRRVVSFERALTERNRLLLDPRPDLLWMDMLEDDIAALGVAVAAARIETIARLIPLLAQEGKGAPFPSPHLALEGVIEGALLAMSASEVEDWYRADLKAARTRDRAAGRTLSGPHRTDLLVRHSEKDRAAALASTGEQKALLIGLMLAKAHLVIERSGMTPVLLLDEIVAHLDATRRELLFSELTRLGCQSFMTGTDAALFSGAGHETVTITIEG